MSLTLVVLAAGLSTRYGGVKQLEPVGPGGATLLDYGIYDALRAGFDRVVLVTRSELKGALRAHTDEIFGAALATDYALQELDALPDGWRAPTGRRKPWGTGHAVLCAESKVGGPFVVMNADDFYGSEAFARLADHLRRSGPSAETDFAAAGYALSDTLSPYGGVSRAVCEVDGAGFLMSVTEVRNIAPGRDRLVGVTVTGEPVRLSGDEIISMNLWAATPAAFPLLRGRFEKFLDSYARDLEAEFLLSTSVNELIAAEAIRVAVIPTPGPWLGMTHPQDRSYVADKLSELVDARHYPEDLAAAARRLAAARTRCES